ncbi:hypothetical protein A2368_03540 [Candidatus Collierbacteria bacterium RIFOXYB1_FULL_49_13]|uniref:UDP-N-acetylglucosamine--N-acetylmuramyl-(pentapeptide) pyrophosphoryl-undecaprenol N-acetylglucosamine transferase n=1 Tax=Candidatus Collierbacteria bacterium RIFOXYB1_FULL_49_13 TaxID=1817728 RepID=A0A1F5FEN6_9BACT|nr:MAG: hypothetical protein A2368_03540 [Candidatus Collierbacteria bacterium RIFOXYB1_FULL_49_13]
MNKRIVFTGGHHNSALVIALELKRQGYSIHWLGHKFTMNRDKNLSAEYREVTSLGVPFYELKAGKFYRARSPVEYIQIVFGFIQAFYLLLTIRPKLIVSFGGYLAVPVVISGWFLRIPSVTHEQTVVSGWANKAIAPFVKKIFLTHRSSQANFPAQKAVVTGLPIKPSLLSPRIYAKTKPKLIFIMGGKQGSHVINQAIFPLIPKLVKRYQVIHQTGNSSITGDDDRASKIKAALPRPLRQRYIHKSYFFEHDAAKYFLTSSLIICRGGAHTIYEILFLQKKAIVIPIPWVSHDEQSQNAKLVAKLGLGYVLPEVELSPTSLLEVIEKGIKLTVKKRRQSAVITNATQKIIQHITPYLS